MQVQNINFTFKRVNKYSLWIWLLFFSFAYEKPLIHLSSFDRLNPRLFDIVLLLGVTFLFGNEKIYKNIIYKQWTMIVLWFTFVVLIGALIFPFEWNIKKYMFYFLFEYYKGLLAITVMLCIPKRYYSLQTVLSALIVGGIFVSSYCIYELNVGVSEVIITEDKILAKPTGMVWGPYVGSYFEIAVFMPLVASIAFAMLMYGRWISKKLMIILTLFISWPILYTGSRTAIFLFLCSITIIVIVNLKRSIFVILPLLFLFFSTLILTDRFNFLFDSNQNETLARMISLEEDNHHDSIVNRIFLFKDFDFEKYDHGYVMPFIGAGFYVAPISGNARIGYGFHNIYLFAFEQSGIIGVILFILFIYVSIKILREGLRDLDKNSLSYWFVAVVYAYFVASLIVGISGHSFWSGFSTSNFNNLRILLLVFASMIVIDSRSKRKGIRDKNIIS